MYKRQQHLLKSLFKLTARERYDQNLESHRLSNLVLNGTPKRCVFSLQSSIQRYHNIKLIGFSSEQMFDVVADVRRYKDFLPFCKESNVFIQKPNYIKSSLVIGFPPIKESYVSEARLHKPNYVKVSCDDGRVLKHLKSTWKFSNGLESIPQTCIVDFYTSFEFRSLLYSNLVHLIFDQLISQMETAFLFEAQRRYGKPSIDTHILKRRKS